MSDFTMSNDREITFDLTKLTHGQWKGLIRPKKGDEREDSIISRCSDLSIDELDALGEREYRALADAFVKRVVSPISSDPNA